MGEQQRHGIEDLALHTKGTLHKIEPNTKMKRGNIGKSSCIDRKANWDVCAIGADFDHKGLGQSAEERSIAELTLGCKVSQKMRMSD